MNMLVHAADGVGSGRKFSRLEGLNLSYNRLKSREAVMPLGGLEALREVVLVGNPLAGSPKTANVTAEVSTLLDSQLCLQPCSLPGQLVAQRQCTLPVMQPAAAGSCTQAAIWISAALCVFILYTSIP
jgi:hypothetical protein